MGAAAKVSLVVDFEALMLDLRRHGFTQRAVAESIERPESTVKRYAYGSTPDFDTGELLITFWCNATNHTRDQLPRKPDLPSVHTIRGW